MVIRGAVSHFLGRWITSLCPQAVIIEGESRDPPDCYQIIKKLWSQWNYYLLQLLSSSIVAAAVAASLGPKKLERR